MLVKDNQPQLMQALRVWFEQPLALRDIDHRRATHTSKGHGRLEVRTLEATTELNDYLDWPHVQQALRLERRWTRLKTGQTTVEVRYGVTSLTPQQADAAALLKLWRGHWSIENRLHWPRDVLFGEDRAPIHTANSPAVLAVFRNSVLSVLHLLGHPSIKAAREYCAAHPIYALGLLLRSVGDWFT